ncbi:MAG: hypothetical protein IPL86_11665 [Flavobacteriales bacterium]|nr:hypothetical protein [Flavobacteriales bacterium]
MAQKWKDSPTRYSVDPEVLLNTPQYDFTPAFADKKNETLVFTQHPASIHRGNTDRIVGEASVTCSPAPGIVLGKWSEPVKLPIASIPKATKAPIFNSKRTIMYFTRCPSEKKKVFGCDIWMSKKVGNNFSAPVMLALKPAAAKEDTLAIGHPALSDGDDMLVFPSDVKFQATRAARTS